MAVEVAVNIGPGTPAIEATKGSKSIVQTMALPDVKVNAERMLASFDESCQWGSTPDGGMNRVAMNDDDKLVRDWFMEQTKKCGCSHKIDTMGNIFAIRPGINNDLAPVALGSHLDTQPTGGKYDGILGILCALEVLRVVHENNIKTYAPLAIVNWADEEGARFPQAMHGSGVWIEKYTEDYGHALADRFGVTMKEELERAGYLGDVPCSYQKNPLLAHFEVHIEQGPILDQAQQAAGAVMGVQSIRWLKVTIKGRGQHTGSTPMDQRKDSLLGAAKMIVETNEIVTKKLAQLNAKATVAVIESAPQSINTIAESADFTIDVRAPKDGDIDDIEKMVRSTFADIAAQHGLKIDIEVSWTQPALVFDPTMVQCLRESCRDKGCTIDLTSAIGHDSVNTSTRIPTAMLFTRCRDGVSHHPSEYARPEDCVTSAEILLNAFLKYNIQVEKKYGN
ncbi:MAG: hypothetical protein M1834_009322 [Cirrosporium novae-zelandiae]|nr:MAG: hypothetical protein M1834_009322 [Cirrosporium novae-zelandiae]